MNPRRAIHRSKPSRDFEARKRQLSRNKKQKDDRHRTSDRSAELGISGSSNPKRRGVSLRNYNRGPAVDIVDHSKKVINQPVSTFALENTLDIDRNYLEIIPL